MSYVDYFSQCCLYFLSVWFLWYWICFQEFGEKKRKEEEKKEKEEVEKRVLEEVEVIKFQEGLMEMKKRLGKIEETIKGIVLEVKKFLGNGLIKI